MAKGTKRKAEDSPQSTDFTTAPESPNTHDNEPAHKRPTKKIKKEKKQSKKHKKSKDKNQDHPDGQERTTATESSDIRVKKSKKAKSKSDSKKDKRDAKKAKKQRHDAKNSPSQLDSKADTDDPFVVSKSSWVDWSKADFGSDGARKDKFLRLLGASKAKASDNTATKSSSSSSVTAQLSQSYVRHVDQSLSQQFTQGMARKRGGQRRSGLGL
ncbi:hypothetical protein IWQ62_004540 [Dispira parvispora]|uniref:Small acidic protein n=1 Tax=Dispira parvispora TaxID=1520584 RepID=A0A9W8ALQ1_9FUNG|nr:hypothetical protein IWQ62_004540 [Dispira parvispora]